MTAAAAMGRETAVALGVAQVPIHDSETTAAVTGRLAGP
jgi:hypothetical protein